MNTTKNLMLMVGLLMMLVPMGVMASGGKPPKKGFGTEKGTQKSPQRSSTGSASTSQKDDDFMLTPEEQEAIDVDIALSLMQEEVNGDQEGQRLRELQLEQDRALAQQLERFDLHEQNQVRHSMRPVPAHGQTRSAVHQDSEAQDQLLQQMLDANGIVINILRRTLSEAHDPLGNEANIIMNDLQTRGSTLPLILAANNMQEGLRVARLIAERCGRTQTTIDVGNRNVDCLGQIRDFNRSNRGQGFLIFNLCWSQGDQGAQGWRNLCRGALIERAMANCIPTVIVVDEQEALLHELITLKDNGNARLLRLRRMPAIDASMPSHGGVTLSRPSMSVPAPRSHSSSSSSVSQGEQARAVAITGAKKECPICFEAAKADVKTSCCLNAICKECWTASVQSTARSYKPGTCPFCRKDAQL